MEPIVELMVTTGSSRSSLNQSPPNHKNMDKQQLPPTAPTSSETWERNQQLIMETIAELTTKKKKIVQHRDHGNGGT